MKNGGKNKSVAVIILVSVYFGFDCVVGLFFLRTYVFFSGVLSLC